MNEIEKGEKSFKWKSLEGKKIYYLGAQKRS